MTETPQTCPHCESHLVEWRVPEEASWNEDFFFVCFNDDCPYFEEGWEWMPFRITFNRVILERFIADGKIGSLDSNDRDHSY